MSETAQFRVAETPLELNPALDSAKLADAFQREGGRLHISNVLTKPSADRIYRCLTQETKWSLTFNKGSDFLDIPNVSEDERSKLVFAAWQRARNEFQYFFDNHRLSVDGEPYPDPSRFHAKIVAFLNSPTTLNFIRKVTGISEIDRTDAQATLYRQGDFLTMHDDKIGGHKRLAAYVLNMTPVWSPDWGGILQFIGPDGHIAEGFVPAFNALNVFRVPALHCVTQVALYGSLRYSITGWFHAR